MFKRVSVSRLAFIMAFITCAGGSALAAKTPTTVIVTPSRIRVVQLVQDMFRTRPVLVVSYQGSSATADPALHKWDGRAWSRITIEDFQATLPERIVMIGDQKALPVVLVEVASRSEDSRTIPTFDVASILGEFQKLFDLSPSEMSRLAQNNGVQIVDRNADLRRYGRYYPGPGFDKLQEKPAIEGSEKSVIPPEPELPPVKIEPPSQERVEPAPAVKSPAVKAPAPAEKIKVDAAPEEK